MFKLIKAYTDLLNELKHIHRLIKLIKAYTDFIKLIKAYTQTHIHIYYCMTARAIQGKYCVRDRPYWPNQRRGDTEVENGILPRIARPEEFQ